MSLRLKRGEGVGLGMQDEREGRHEESPEAYRVRVEEGHDLAELVECITDSEDTVQQECSQTKGLYMFYLLSYCAGVTRFIHCNTT